jgi:hypothetical protein
LPVAWPKRPPNVIMGERQAKYKKIQEAIHCRASASLKSDQYLNNDYKTTCKWLHNNYFKYVNKQMRNVYKFKLYFQLQPLILKQNHFNNVQTKSKHTFLNTMP